MNKFAPNALFLGGTSIDQFFAPKFKKLKLESSWKFTGNFMCSKMRKT
jgi:hypothetical protein